MNKKPWQPVDLREKWDDEREPLTPTCLRRESGEALIYPGKVHWVYGRPECGKTWLALVAALEVLRSGGVVLYLDYEMDEDAARDRLRTLGAERSDLAQLRYVAPNCPIREADDAGALSPLLAGVSLVVVDACQEAMGYEGYDMLSNKDTEAFAGEYVKALGMHGAAVLIIDHVSKAPQFAGSGAIGAGHKGATTDVAYRVEKRQEFGRGRSGYADVVCEKDRYGAIRAIEDPKKVVAELHLTFTPDGLKGSAELRAPSGATADYAREQMRGEISDFLAECGPCPKRAVEASVVGKAKHIRENVRYLIENGYVSVTKSGNADLLDSVQPYVPADALASR